MNILDHTNIHPYSGTSFNISYEDGTVMLMFSNGDWIIDHSNYVHAFSRGLKDLEYDSILIGGLGLGLMPEWIKQNTSCSIVDVVENNTELISWVSSSNYLNESINVVEGDIFEYTPSKTYDLILVDIWWTATEGYETHKQELITKYSGSLNSSGSLYMPIATEFFNF